MNDKNILIIDDDSAMIKLFELIAKKYGLKVVSATNGAEGLKKLGQQEFILVITDLKMPIMSGVDFIKQARKIPKFLNYPFVIITGNLKEFNSEVALLGNLTLMEKPIKQSEFQELLEHRLMLNTAVSEFSITPKEFYDFLQEKIKKTTSLMIKIIIKSDSEIIESIPPSSLYEGNFFSSHLLIFQKFRVGVVFNFETSIATAISSEIAKGSNLDSKIIMECLAKVSNAIMKKIFENSPYPTELINSIPLGLIGVDQNKASFSTQKEHVLANIYNKTNKGNMIVHILNF